MASPTCLVIFLCYFMVLILSILSQFVVIPLNEFRIHVNCMNLIQKWSVTLNVCLLIIMIITVLT